MQVYLYVEFFPIVNTTVLPGPWLAESEDVEPGYGGTGNTEDLL